MGTSYDIHCADCDVGMGLDAFNAATLGAIIRQHHALVAVSLDPDGGFWDATLTVGACNEGRIRFEFLQEHEGHLLRVRSEYGEWMDECNDWFDPAKPAERVTCVYGDIHKHCRRPGKHAGDHAPDPEGAKP